MPQGFTFGDNRFCLLGQNTGPGAKRKMKDNQATFVPFPQLSDTKQANPKYIIMESIAANKPLSKFSCFRVYKSIINKCSMREALKKYRETTPNAPTSPITKSYSSVTRETISTAPPSPVQKSSSPVARKK